MSVKERKNTIEMFELYGKGVFRGHVLGEVNGLYFVTEPVPNPLGHETHFYHDEVELPRQDATSDHPYDNQRIGTFRILPWIKPPLVSVTPGRLLSMYPKFASAMESSVATSTHYVKWVDQSIQSIELASKLFGAARTMISKGYSDRVSRRMESLRRAYLEGKYPPENWNRVQLDRETLGMLVDAVIVNR